MRTTPRERRPVSPGTLRALKPLFRYSIGRDAYVLRAIGNRTGPVLVVRREPRASSSPMS
ncbi:MAG: hypothetical protein ACXVVU_25830 [Solirubrobacteraceae bacterium]